MKPIFASPEDSSPSARPLTTRGSDVPHSGEVAQAPRLPAVIRQLCASTTVADPRELATLAVAEIADDDLRDELVNAATGVAREIIRALRQYEPPTDSPDGLAVHDAQSGPAVGAPSPSRHGRVALMRGWVAEQMRARVHVGAEWKLLRDCTLEDLAFAAAQRREIAARTEAEAERYDRLAKAVADAGAATVADIDEAAFAAAWGQA